MAGRISHLTKAAAPPLLRRLFGLGQSQSSQTRSFGAAAEIQYYNYEDDEEEAYIDQARLAPVADSEGSISGRGVQWVFIGNPGSKKHLYADKLSKILQVPHISMGSLVRQELHPRSSLYKQIANSVNQGKLVPEDIIFGLLSKRLEEGYYRGETGFILDGIPRNEIQAEILDQIADVDLVVNFKCTEECVVKKRLGACICPRCQESLVGNLGSANLKLNSGNAQLEPSTGDRRREKLRNYAEQKKPLEDYYKKQKKLIDFQVANAPGETWQGLLAALHLQHVNAIRSSHKLMS